MTRSSKIEMVHAGQTISAAAADLYEHAALKDLPPDEAAAFERAGDQAIGVLQGILASVLAPSQVTT